MRVILRNFRSVQSQEIEIAPITLIYGPNASGKSSIIYGLLVLRNVVLAPNQSVQAFLNFQVKNLGSFREIVFDHNESRRIKIGIEIQETLVEGNKTPIQYGVEFQNNEGRFFLQIHREEQSGEWGLPVTFPYPGNQQTEIEFRIGSRMFQLTWTGLVVAPVHQTPESKAIARFLNRPIEVIRTISYVPHRRGFFQPQYSFARMSPYLIQEDEVASLLAEDRYLEGEVSYVLENIAKRQFRVRPHLGTGLFSLMTLDRKTGLLTELVNDGFGINQLVYLLAKVLYKDSRIVCIEEPEIHLHPSALRRLAGELVQIVREREKFLIMTTHSEAFVTAFLSLIARGKLNSTEISCYLVNKEDKKTLFKVQKVNDFGQVEGGLISFMEGELEDIRAFLGVHENDSEAQDDEG